MRNPSDVTAGLLGNAMPQEQWHPTDGGIGNTRRLLAALLVAIGYYCGALIGFALTFEPLPVSVLWPPNSVLVAALLLAPPRQWWLILTFVFPAHLAAELQSGVPMAMLLAWFASNCSEALIGAVIVRRLLGERLRFDSLRHVGLFVFVCAFLAPFISSFLDAALVTLIGWGQGSYWQLWRLRFFSNVLAILAFVPVFLTWDSSIIASIRGLPAMHRLQGSIWALALLGVSCVAFITGLGSSTGMRLLPQLLLYAPLAILLWAAVRFNTFTMSISFLAVTFLAIWGATHGHGPFISDSPATNALSIQLFLIGIAVPLLLLSAAMQERRQTHEALLMKDELERSVAERTAELREANATLEAEIAQRRRAEEAERISEREAQKQRAQLTHLTRVALLGEFSGALAHELNQPLTAILSNAQAARRFLAADRIDLQEIRDILEDIVNEDKRAGEVIRRLRALFMKDDPKPQSLDLNQVVNEALDLAQSDLITRNVKVTVRLQPGLSAIRGDRVQLQQVLLNLILNACEAMNGNAPDQRELTFHTWNTDGDVWLVISDSGCGVPADAFDRLFDSFFTTKVRGLGFGLSISRSIVTEHGGRIEAGNNPDGGATFRITLPAQSKGRT
ncbi:MAG: hypothetical protein JWM42_2578 [Burkholderia sp.]|nr:hypothetical protein [Burkholderia sp.]